MRVAEPSFLQDLAFDRAMEQLELYYEKEIEKLPKQTTKYKPLLFNEKEGWKYN
jgi:hypothetical protein